MRNLECSERKIEFDYKSGTGVDYTSAYKKFVGKDKVVFSRAGFSGQHTISIQWAGDQQPRPEEMKSVLKAELSAAASGILFWGFDIAGFAGPLPSMDLYRRATQFACFCPIMQWHSEPEGGAVQRLNGRKQRGE